ncbi:MAG: hypothetical protein IPG81_26550 [Sandaracinaceae bacterium]|nr:hypothetical protein [Sandaracinaceae bacterium]
MTRRAKPRSTVDATDLVSPELLGQLKVRRVLVQRALERLCAEQPPSAELRALVELFEAYDGSVGALVELLSLDTPSGVVESRQRQSSPGQPTRARGPGPTR